MLRPVRTGAPSEALLTLEEVKAHCRVDFSDDDALLTSLIQAATDHLDGWSGVLGRCLVNQNWRIDLPDWPASRCIRLPFPDVSNVTVKYFDADNQEITVAPSLYETVEDERGVLVRLLDSFTAPTAYDDRSGAVRIEFTAGYGAAADVPQSIKIAALLLIGHWYEHREGAEGKDVRSVPLAVDRLITPLRRVFF